MTLLLCIAVLVPIRKTFSSLTDTQEEWASCMQSDLCYSSLPSLRKGEASLNIQRYGDRRCLADPARQALVCNTRKKTGGCTGALGIQKRSSSTFDWGKDVPSLSFKTLSSVLRRYPDWSAKSSPPAGNFSAEPLLPRSPHSGPEEPTQVVQPIARAFHILRQSCADKFPAD